MYESVESFLNDLPPMKLLLATSNLHKIREYRMMLKPLKGLDLLTFRNFPAYIPPEESGNTFEENAVIKAVHAAKELQLATLADDSGLVVPALQGEPGIYSARYAGKDATDADNRKKLLEKVKALSEDKRNAYFECVIALALPEGLKKVVRGTCEGQLITEEKGGNGFGYDPIFKKYDYSKTLAELEEEVKNKISHRRKALDKILPTLENIVREHALSH
ncbi:MAG: non-canonical purine NTP pyrophosphatase [Simkaniaceae bacterium]